MLLAEGGNGSICLFRVIKHVVHFRLSNPPFLLRSNCFAFSRSGLQTFLVVAATPVNAIWLSLTYLSRQSIFGTRNIIMTVIMRSRVCQRIGRKIDVYSKGRVNYAI